MLLTFLALIQLLLYPIVTGIVDMVVWKRLRKYGVCVIILKQHRYSWSVQFVRSTVEPVIPKRRSCRVIVNYETQK